MAKITIPPVTSQFNTAAALTSRFKQIEDEFNNKVLYRANPTGEPNSMSNDLDMNNRRVLNLPEPVAPTEPLRLQDFDDGVTEAVDEYLDSINVVRYEGTGPTPTAGQIPIFGYNGGTSLLNSGKVPTDFVENNVVSVLGNRFIRYSVPAVDASLGPRFVYVDNTGTIVGSLYSRAVAGFVRPFIGEDQIKIDYFNDEQPAETAPLVVRGKDGSWGRIGVVTSQTDDTNAKGVQMVVMPELSPSSYEGWDVNTIHFTKDTGYVATVGRSNLATIRAGKGMFHSLNLPNYALSVDSTGLFTNTSGGVRIQAAGLTDDSFQTRHGLRIQTNPLVGSGYSAGPSIGFSSVGGGTVYGAFEFSSVGHATLWNGDGRTTRGDFSIRTLNTTGNINVAGTASITGNTTVSNITASGTANLQGVNLGGDMTGSGSTVTVQKVIADEVVALLPTAIGDANFIAGAQRLIGNPTTTSNGSVQEIELGAGLQFSSSALQVDMPSVASEVSSQLNLQGMAFVEAPAPLAGPSMLNGDGIWEEYSAQPRGSLIQGANVILTGDLTDRLLGAGDITISASGGGGGSGGVATVTSGNAFISVDNTDIENPTVSWVPGASINSVGWTGPANSLVSYNASGVMVSTARSGLGVTSPAATDANASVLNFALQTTSGRRAISSVVDASNASTIEANPTDNSWYGYQKNGGTVGSKVQFWTTANFDPADVGNEQPTSFTVGYGSNGLPNLVTEVYPTGNRTEAITYNADGTVNTVTYTKGSVVRVETYTYTDGNLTGMTSS